MKLLSVFLLLQLISALTVTVESQAPALSAPTTSGELAAAQYLEEIYGNPGAFNQLQGLQNSSFCYMGAVNISNWQDVCRAGISHETTAGNYVVNVSLGWYQSLPWASFFASAEPFRTLAQYKSQHLMRALAWPSLNKTFPHPSGWLGQ